MDHGAADHRFRRRDVLPGLDLGAWKMLLATGAGTGLVLLLRWYWWRINAWSEISAMITAAVTSLVLQTGLGFGHRQAARFRLDHDSDGRHHHRGLARGHVSHGARNPRTLWSAFIAASGRGARDGGR